MVRSSARWLCKSHVTCCNPDPTETLILVKTGMEWRKPKPQSKERLGVETLSPKDGFGGVGS